MLVIYIALATYTNARIKNKKIKILIANNSIHARKVTP
jgi:hypothetical protein